MMIWKDLLDIRIGGILPVGEKVEDFIMALFPRTLETLEEMRVKNPMAWRETMKYLMPLMLSLKYQAQFKGKEFLDGALDHIAELVQGVMAPAKKDQDDGKGIL